MRLTTLFATLCAAFFTALPVMAQTQTALVAGGVSGASRLTFAASRG